MAIHTQNFTNFLSLTHKYSLQSRFWQTPGYNWHALHTTLSLFLSNTHTHAAPSHGWTRGPQGIELQPKAVTLAEKPAGHLHSLRSHRLHPSHHGSARLSVCPAVSLHHPSFKLLANPSVCPIIQSVQFSHCPITVCPIANKTLDFWLSTPDHQLCLIILRLFALVDNCDLALTINNEHFLLLNNVALIVNV